jgi:penicillin amidase
LSSANQHSTDTTYPYYLNWEFDAYMRGRRINEVLQGLENATVEDLKALQLDNHNLLARDLLAQLLELLDTKSLEPVELEARKVLASWNLQNGAEEVGASLFVFWWENLERGIWKDELMTSRGFLKPPITKTMDLLKDSLASQWFDDVHTEPRESRAVVVLEAFRATVRELQRRFGDDPAEWQWSRVNNPSVPHVLELPGMGEYGLDIGGGKHIVNQQQHKHGPSWRLVVDLQDDPVAFGAIPGGQSGNPGSPYYTNLLHSWADGSLVRLRLWAPENMPEEEKPMTWNLSPDP